MIVNKEFHALYFHNINSFIQSLPVTTHDVCEQIWVTVSSSCMVCVTFPGTFIRSRPLEDGEMPTFSCNWTSTTVPFASIRPTTSCSWRCPTAPTATILSQPLQTSKLSIFGSSPAQLVTNITSSEYFISYLRVSFSMSPLHDVYAAISCKRILLLSL